MLEKCAYISMALTLKEQGQNHTPALLVVSLLYSCIACILPVPGRPARKGPSFQQAAVGCAYPSAGCVSAISPPPITAPSR